MSRPNSKNQTLAQRFGFSDPDLKTPGHDWILLRWLTKERLRKIAVEIYTPERCGWGAVSVPKPRLDTRQHYRAWSFSFQ